jgi:hypothetical protein
MPGSLLTDKRWQLRKVPDLRQLKERLIHLQLSCVSLTSVPGWLGELENLETLTFDGSNLEITALPEIFGKLPKLRKRSGCIPRGPRKRRRHPGRQHHFRARKAWHGALRPPPLQNPLQREQNRASIARRKAAAVGQKGSKVEEEEEEGKGGGQGGQGEETARLVRCRRKRISDAR